MKADDFLDSVAQSPRIKADDFLDADGSLAPTKQSGSLRRIADVGVSLGKGIASIPELAVGLADIPTGGRVGKALKDAGVDFKGIQSGLDEYFSPEQKEANRQVSEAEGFVGTLNAAFQNPSTIVGAIAESAPLLIPGMGIARGLGAVSKLSPLVRGAIGEGVTSAGLAAERTRQETEDGTLSGKQSLSAVGSGLGTAAFGMAGGKLGQKLGITDIDTFLAGKSATQASKQGFMRRIGGGALVEGVFEELPQSAQEQIWQNYALDKPLMEGVPEAGAMGMLAGGAMGAGFSALQRGSPDMGEVNAGNDIAPVEDIQVDPVDEPGLYDVEFGEDLTAVPAYEQRKEDATNRFYANEQPPSFLQWARDMDLGDFIMSMPNRVSSQAMTINEILRGQFADSVKELAAARLWKLGQSAKAGPLAKATGQLNQYGFYTASIPAVGAPIMAGEQANFASTLGGIGNGATDQGGQVSPVDAQGDQGESADVPGSGGYSQTGLLGGLAGGSGSTAVPGITDGSVVPAGNAGVQSVDADSAMWLDAETVAASIQSQPAAEREALLNEIASRDAGHADEIRSLLTPASAPAPKTDGSSEVVGASGMSIVHGSGNPNFTVDDIQIVRQGQKQGKKGRSYGGLYGAAEQDVAHAEEYAAMMGGTPTVYDLTIRPGTKVLHKEGDITRLSENYINGLVEQGYGVVTGKDMRGRNEYVVIDRNAVAAMQPRSTTPTTPLPDATGANQSVTQAVPASLPVESAATQAEVLEYDGMVPGFPDKIYKTDAGLFWKSAGGKIAPLSSHPDAKRIADFMQRYPQEWISNGMVDVNGGEIKGDSGRIIEAVKPETKNPGTSLTRKGRFTVEFNGQEFEVGSIKDAADKWNKFVDASQGGVSQVGNGVIIREDGKPVARVSYNGRIWDMNDNEITGDSIVPKPSQLPQTQGQAQGAEGKTEGVAPSLADIQSGRATVDRVNGKIDEWVNHATNNGTRPMDRNWERIAVKRFIEAEIAAMLSGKQYGNRAAAKIAIGKSITFDDLRAAIAKYADVPKEAAARDEVTQPASTKTDEVSTPAEAKDDEIQRKAKGKKVTVKAVIAETGQVTSQSGQDAEAEIQRIRKDLDALAALQICLGA